MHFYGENFEKLFFVSTFASVWASKVGLLSSNHESFFPNNEPLIYYISMNLSSLKPYCNGLVMLNWKHQISNLAKNYVANLSKSVKK